MADPLTEPRFQRFLAVGRMGLRLTSADGVAWSAPQLHQDPHTLGAIAAGDGCVVAMGMAGTGANAFYRSTDLQQWEVQTLKSEYVFLARSVAYGDGRFLALLSSGTTPNDPGALHRSADGKEWGERVKRAKGKPLGRARWAGGQWVGIGAYGMKAVSRDGLAWDEAPDQSPADTLIDLAYGNGVWVGVGLHGLRMASPDGVRWGARQVGEEGEHIHCVVFTGTEFVGVGLGATYRSRDGRTWTRTPNTDAPVCCAYGRGQFVGAAYKGRLLVSKDGVAWKQVHKCEQHVQAIAFV